jgi:hypothetical protein
MALPTTENPQPIPPQRATPNVTPGTRTPDRSELRMGPGTLPADYEGAPTGMRMGPAPEGIRGGTATREMLENVKPQPPILFDDLDPVYLARLYPDSFDAGAAREKAMEAGQAAYDMSTEVFPIASLSSEERQEMVRAADGRREARQEDRQEDRRDRAEEMREQHASEGDNPEVGPDRA